MRWTIRQGRRRQQETGKLKQAASSGGNWF
jgi:hypothetical protein